MMNVKFGPRYIIINHFGIKPISGGIPPKDKRRIGIMIILLNENDALSVNWLEKNVFEFLR